MAVGLHFLSREYRPPENGHYWGVATVTREVVPPQPERDIRGLSYKFTKGLGYPTVRTGVEWVNPDGAPNDSGQLVRAVTWHYPIPRDEVAADEVVRAGEQAYERLAEVAEAVASELNGRPVPLPVVAGRTM
jgi:hypothetical protein